MACWRNSDINTQAVCLDTRLFLLGNSWRIHGNKCQLGSSVERSFPQLSASSNVQQRSPKIHEWRIQPVTMLDPYSNL